MTAPAITTVSTTVPASLFFRGLDEVKGYACKDKTLPQIAGVRLEVSEHGATVIATDRFRLLSSRTLAADTELEAVTDPRPEVSATLDNTLVKQLIKTARDHKLLNVSNTASVTITVTSEPHGGTQRVTVTSQDNADTADLLDEEVQDLTFPMWRALIQAADEVTGGTRIAMDMLGGSKKLDLVTSTVPSRASLLEAAQDSDMSLIGVVMPIRGDGLNRPLFWAITDQRRCSISELLEDEWVSVASLVDAGLLDKGTADSLARHGVDALEVEHNDNDDPRAIFALAGILRPTNPEDHEVTVVNREGLDSQ